MKSWGVLVFPGPALPPWLPSPPTGIYVLVSLTPPLFSASEHTEFNEQFSGLKFATNLILLFLGLPGLLGYPGLPF